MVATKDTNSISIGGIKIVIGNSACEEIPKELAARGVSRPLVVTDPGIRDCGALDFVTAALESAGVSFELFDRVPSDPPSAVVAEGAAAARLALCDGVVAVGGGSVMDAAKAMAVMVTNEGSILEYDNSPSGGRSFEHDGLPVFSVPTTSGTGSEVTQYAVITSEAEGRKATIGSERLTSKVAFLSPLMTLGLPPAITAATGVDALAHAIEALTSVRVLTARGSTVFSDTYALEAVRHISRSLTRAYACGSDLEARKDLMLGSTLAGFITQAGSGAAHGLGTPLGARYHVPHGLSVGMLLPYVMEHNIIACPERYALIAEAMGQSVASLPVIDAARLAPAAVRELLEAIEFPHLDAYVPTRAAAIELAEAAVADKCTTLNARPVSLEQAQKMYAAAWDRS